MSGADITYINEVNETLLFIAINKRKEDIAILLLKNPYFQTSALINQSNAFGDTLLTIASYHNQEKLVSKLLSIKAIDINKEGPRNCSALHCAIHKNHLNIVELLIKHGANPMLVDEKGATIAFYNCILTPNAEYKEVARTIINHVDNAGNTHIHLLAQAEISSMAQVAKRDAPDLFDDILSKLVKQGLSIWVINNAGKLPIEIAYERYQRLKKQYKKDKIFYHRKVLADQEKILHRFLRYYVSKKQYPYIEISSLYAGQLNVETAIAQQFAKDEKYFSFSSEYKDRIKGELIKDISSVEKIWISKFQYIPLDDIN